MRKFKFVFASLASLSLVACAHEGSQPTSALPDNTNAAAVKVAASSPDALNPVVTTVSEARPTPPAQPTEFQPGVSPARVVVEIDQAIGEHESKPGQYFTATVVPAKEGSQPVIPVGTKLVLRVDKLQPAMNGSQGTIVLSVHSIKGPDEQHQRRIDARVIAVELSDNHPGGRPVNGGGNDVIGAIIQPKDETPNDVARDPLQKRAIISLGTGDTQHQLEKGTRIAVEIRGIAPVAMANSEIRDMTRLYDEDQPNLLGQTVILADVPVESVIGDVVFWIGPSKQHRTLVVLDKAIDTPEDAIIVRKGDRVSFSAVVERTPTNAEAPRLWKLVTAKEAAELTGHPLYLFAYEAKVTTRVGEVRKTAASK